MKIYRGAVLFIDMLGFNALTRGMLKLSSKECEPWKVSADDESAHQLLAATLLVEFRKVLTSTLNACQGIKIAQLSDCCFIWSENCSAVADAGRHFMSIATRAGLLCRGGFAIGQIVEPDKLKRSLGAFIVGDAATRAATLEGSGKGARIFTDDDTASEILMLRPNERFQPLTNPLTGVIVDEWLWYAPLEKLTICRSRNTALRKTLDTLVGYHTVLRYSPKLAWSATSLEGRRQIACSIAAVSTVMQHIAGDTGSYDFSVTALLETGDIRSETQQRRVQDQFVDDLFRILEPLHTR